MSPPAASACMSRADVSIASLIHLPMHLKYFISIESGERIMRKKHYQKVSAQGKAEEHKQRNRNTPGAKRREDVEEGSKDI